MLELQRGGDSSSPDARNTKPSGEQSGMTASRPDLIGEADRKTRLLKRSSKDENLHLLNGDSSGSKSRLNMTQGAIDIEKIMANVTGTVTGETSDDNDVDDGEVSTAIDLGEATAIRKQLDGLENMQKQWKFQTLFGIYSDLFSVEEFEFRESKVFIQNAKKHKPTVC